MRLYTVHSIAKQLCEAIHSGIHGYVRLNGDTLSSYSYVTIMNSDTRLKFGEFDDRQT